MEYRDIDAAHFEFRLADKAAGIVEIRANVMGITDSYDSSFEPGVFDAAVRDQAYFPYLLMDHSMDRQIGRVTDTRERRDASGVWQWAKAKVNTSKQIGQDALSDLEQGFRDAWSVGFASDPKEERFEKRDGKTVRLIRRLQAWPDLSSVLLPGGSGTATLSVRSSALLIHEQASDVRAAEHVAIFAPTEEYTEVRSAVSHEEGKPYVTVWGHSAGPLGWIETLHRYPIASWTEAESRHHAQAAGGIEFIAATGQARQSQPLIEVPRQTLLVPSLSVSADTLLDYRAVAVKEGAPKSPPSGYPSDKSKYADPTNYKYPVDSDARIHAAVAYYNHSGQQSAGDYSDDEWAAVGRKIVSAANTAFGGGYKLDGGSIASPSKSGGDGESSGRSADLSADIETRMRYESLRFADLGVEVRHAALSKANTAAARQAHDTMAAAVPGFCPNQQAEEAAEGEPSPGS